MDYTGRCESSKKREAQPTKALQVHRTVRACRRGRLHRPCPSITRLVDPGGNAGGSPRDGQRSYRRLHRGAHEERGACPIGHVCRNGAPRSPASCCTGLNAPAEPQTPAGDSGPSTSRLCCSPSPWQPRVHETSPQTGDPDLCASAFRGPQTRIVPRNPQRCPHESGRVPAVSLTGVRNRTVLRKQPSQFPQIRNGTSSP